MKQKTAFRNKQIKYVNKRLKFSKMIEFFFSEYLWKNLNYFKKAFNTKYILRFSYNYVYDQNLISASFDLSFST